MPTHYSGTPTETLALNTFIKLTRSVNSLMSRLSQRGAIGDAVRRCWTYDAGALGADKFRVLLTVTV